MKNREKITKPICTKAKFVITPLSTLHSQLLKNGGMFMDRETNIQKRREDRQQALQLVYERMFRDDTLEDVRADALDARDEEISDYAKQLIEGIEAHKDEVDELIEKNLKGWKINRISKIALAAMRISVYEMKYIKSVPVSVSINEAVSMTKKFAADKDGSFVNGVLGAVAKNLSGEK